MKNKSIVLGCAVILSLLGMQVFAVCPSDGCYGGLFCRSGRILPHCSMQWLTGDGVPNDMLPSLPGPSRWGIRSMKGISDERPVHTVTLDSICHGQI